jgi:hypothetical protein
MSLRNSGKVLLLDIAGGVFGASADDHGTHVAENGSKNQSFEWGKYAHSLRLL